MTNPNINQQSHNLFLEEASELLQILEQDLLSIREDYSINKVHNLMRTTHTLKGAAASVDLETIKTISHSFEDIFKALLQPDLSIDSEIEALLFEGYECLRLCLTAELTGEQINETEILDRTAAVFAQLQDKLGDCFNQEITIPSSAELGFDIAQSIFEVGVNQRLEELTAVLARSDPQEVANTLITQAEVFLGLAESLALPGFGAIAQTAIAALDAHPEQVIEIAELALADFQAGKAAVLKGDRTQGGQPSLRLQELGNGEWGIGDQELEIEAPLPPVSSTAPVNVQESETETESDEVTTVDLELIGSEAQQQEVTEPSLETIQEETPVAEEIFPHELEESPTASMTAQENMPSELLEESAVEPITTQDSEVSTELEESAVEPITTQDLKVSTELEESVVEPITTQDLKVSTEPEESAVEPITAQDSEVSTELEESAAEPITAEDSEVFTELEESAVEPITAQDSEVSTEPREIPSTEDSVASELANEEAIDSLLESIWGTTLVTQEITDSESEESPAETGKVTSTEDSESMVSQVDIEEEVKQPPVINPSQTTKTQVPQSSTVRVNVEHLEYLNYTVGELLTNQNRQSLQNEQLRIAVKTLLNRLQEHQQLLTQLQDWSDHLFILSEKQRTKDWKLRTREERQQGSFNSQFPIPNSQFPIPKQQNRFDSLELDQYSESQLLVQSALENAVQLTEATDAIELFTTQSNQTLEKQRRLLTSTRDFLMEARMLPLGELLSRFPQVLLQLSTLHKKPVELKLLGKEVLVDKVVAQKLYDPLLHLVRNAFSHGIESPEVRQQLNKPREGKIEICAFHQSGYLVIEVRDDGQGLDFEKIRQQAVELLYPPEKISSLNEAQLTDLLFEPGFSTASGINDLSGRGMGLDVVHTQLQSLQGSVTINSQLQQGTTFRLQIPLSITISNLLITQAGKYTYALLADAVEQILIPLDYQIRSWDSGKVLRWGTGADEQLIPVYQLANALDYYSPIQESLALPSSHSFGLQQQAKPIILIRCQDQLLGLEVDQLLGDQELVIRPLGAMINSPRYIYGGSILADGQLALVLDGTVLMQHLCERQSNGALQETVVDATPHILSPVGQQKQLPAQTLASEVSSVTLSLVSPEPDLTSKANKMVLLVDDSITVRQTLAMTLERAGYKVFQAKDGYEALEQLRSHQEIQVVLCDIEMPRMNGFEFLKHHQQDSALKKIPVVILTSRSGDKHRLIATELGATAYITKPYLEHQLLAIVDKCITFKK